MLLIFPRINSPNIVYAKLGGANRVHRGQGEKKKKTENSVALLLKWLYAKF